MLRELVGHEAEVRPLCPRCGGPHGPLTTTIAGRPGPLISVAYANPVVVVGVGPENAAAFGIDVELDLPDRRTAVREAIGTDEVTEWTRLEAIAKARREGIRDGVSRPRVHGSAAGWRVDARAGELALVGFDLRVPSWVGGPAAVISVASGGGSEAARA